MKNAETTAPTTTAVEYIATHKICGYFARFELPAETIGRDADVLLNHPCFTREQCSKGRKFIGKNKNNEPLLAQFHARCVEIYNAESGAIDAAAAAAKAKKAFAANMERTVAQTCAVWAAVIAAEHTTATGEMVSVPTLAAVMNPGFVYSKQRADGGCTIYAKSVFSPTGVESCGAGTVAQIAIAGRLLQRNAYVGQQWEKLN